MKMDEIVGWKETAGWFLAGFIGGPVLLNISPAVTTFFWWLGTASFVFFIVCLLMVCLGIVPYEREDYK